MRTDLNELRTFLNREFESRKKFDHSYSKNVFTRDHDIPATTLNAFLQDEGELIENMLNKVNYPQGNLY